MSVALRRGLALAAGAFWLVVLGGLRASAGDGRAEINQTCAVQTGCFPGDGAGFPVVVGEPGSYLLTEDLLVPNANTTAIDVQADDVTIDLNGFSIRGMTACSGAPASCSPVGSGNGIHSANENVAVRNGTIRGMGGNGIVLSGEMGRVEDVIATSNARSGIELSVSGAATVVRSRAALNGHDGLRIGFGSVVLGNAADGNGTSSHRGIQVFGSASVVVGNTVVQSGGVGIEAITSVISGNTVNRSGVDGIVAGVACAVYDNTVVDSAGRGVVSLEGVVAGNTIARSGGDGISSSGSDLIMENTIRSSSGDAIDFAASTTSGYAENTTSGTSGAEVAGTGVLLGCNALGGVQVCPP